MEIETKVIKRDGTTVDFDRKKIENAILQAMKNGSGIYEPDIAEDIADDLGYYFDGVDEVSISQIESEVFDRLNEHRQTLTAKMYEGYRAVQAYKKRVNTTDTSILGLMDTTNEEVLSENSNKNGILLPTQRDLMAGECSKDLVKRFFMPSHLVQAHDEGIIHIHDMDYISQKMFNCCVFNLQDMLDNGTVINGKLIRSPKSFRTACTVTTQIIAQIASGQFGGQSLNIKHLAKYIRKSYEKFIQEVRKEQEDFYGVIDKRIIEEIAWNRTKKEVKDGVQTIQYQTNTLQTSNGQSPFISIYMQIEEGYEYERELELLIKEILEQRYQGIENEEGIYITPAFPKLLYVLDECNVREGSKYFHLTQLAVKTSAKRLSPDYISAKIMRQNYEGNVFPCMGCRSFLSPYKNEKKEYIFESRFNMGVVSLNLPQIGIICKGNEDLFWEILDERLKLCKEALLSRYKRLKGTLSDVSPIHWQYGGIARLNKGETIDKYLGNGFATISLGYIGIYELNMLMKNEPHTANKDFSLRVLKRMKQACEDWRQETGLGFSLYGTPSEGLCNRFCQIDKQKFGVIKDVTDKGWYTNSFHVDVREKIDAFSKLSFESEYHSVTSGGTISYIEVPNLTNNLRAVEQVVQFIYDNIQYAEINTKSDYCHICGYDGEIKLDDKFEWYCPNCGNRDEKRMNVVRRTCGYIGENFWNEGKTKEIAQRVLHL